MRRPRSGARSRRQADEFPALEPDRAGGDAARRIDEPDEREAGDDLPEPDSPTSPRISPRASREDTPSTALHDAGLGVEMGLEVLDDDVAESAASLTAEPRVQLVAERSPTRLMLNIDDDESDARIDADPVAAGHHVPGSRWR